MKWIVYTPDRDLDSRSLKQVKEFTILVESPKIDAEKKFWLFGLEKPG
ncbi:hypothetical protein LWC08_15020 [Desulfobaculum bizertense]|nr:hypothetical protein [Desulfobaculum bizertense]UIJ37982.1 hypothetical protein LWC08_15020 [Desulfobaculum bizertense]